MPTAQENSDDKLISLQLDDAQKTQLSKEIQDLLPGHVDHEVPALQEQRTIES